MNYRDTCPHCGHVSTAYTLRMNEPMIRAFIAFATARHRLGRPVKKGELELTNAQYSNFQNLRHFGLIHQPEKGRHWEMTPLGWAFLRGKSSIFTPAAHLGGVTLLPTHPAWRTHEEARKDVFIRDVLPDEWKDRSEFQAEKIGA